jgi:cytochrome c553
MKGTLWVSLGILFWGTVANAAIDLKGDPKAGSAKIQTCIACHNADGNSTTPIWPNLGGQSEKYLIEQLEAFKKGDKGARFDPVMYGMTQALSDQDIADLSAYFASQKPVVGVAKQDLVALGEKIYRGGNPKTGVAACSACHGPKGDGNDPAGFPRLSGQHSEYVLDQLKKFKSGARSNDPNEIMRDISKRLTDEEMQAVSSYVSGLH